MRTLSYPGDASGEALAIVGVHAREHGLDPRRVALGEAVQPQESRGPVESVRHRVPVPRRCTGGVEREAEALLADAQLAGGGLERGRALVDASLQLAVQRLELVRLAVELGEHGHFRAQDLRHDGDRDEVDRAGLVAAQEVDVRHVSSRDEDDGGLLVTGMLADERGELEAVELGHLHVDQHHRDVLAQQAVERLAGGARLDEVLAEAAEDRLVREQFRRLIVDEQDVERCFAHVPRV